MSRRAPALDAGAVLTTLRPYAPPPEDYLAWLRKIEGQVRGL